MSRKVKTDADLTGQKFGRWIVLRKDDNRVSERRWICRCTCGEERSVVERLLLNGHSKSCGCLRSEINSTKYYKHGGIHDRLYHVWISMKQRCYNPNNNDYCNYGGKGVVVCEEWLDDYGAFKAWALENGYDENAEYMSCTIDRINPTKGYSPDNCRWANLFVQSNNKRNTIYYAYMDEKHTLREWSDLLGFDYNRARRRLHDGWSFEDAITKEHQRIPKAYTCNGESHTIKEWAEILNTTDKSIYTRLEQGWSVDRVFSQPFRKRSETINC